MATSTQERLKLGIELNDGVGFTTESLTFSPAQKKPLYVSNADSDGENLVRESHYTPATFELKVRVEPQKSVAAGLAKLGELTDAVQSCEKVAGGRPLEWTPSTTETTYTLYALSADVTGIPTEVQGDDAGWLFGSPVVTVKITCRPFLYKPERVVVPAAESPAEPLQILYVGAIGGDVPAEGRLIVKDTAAQDRRFGAWGREVVTGEAGLPPILLPASTKLNGEGFSGEPKTRTGAYGSEKVLRGVAVSQASTLCGTGRIENVGSYGLYFRVYSTSAASRFRASYRNGDGPLIPLEWKEAPVVNGWSEIFMGEVTLDPVALGAQTSEIRFEQKAVEGNPANDVNYLFLWPTTKASAKARGLANPNPTNLIAYDSFASAGNLDGKALPFPNTATWKAINKLGAEGFVVASNQATRSKASDASLTAGAFATVGETKYKTVQLGGTLGCGFVSSAGIARVGFLARYVSLTKWIMGVLELQTSVAGFLVSHALRARVVMSTEAGGVVNLGEQSRFIYAAPSEPALFTVTAAGAWQFKLGAYPSVSGSNPALATGGELAEGRAGLYDASTYTVAVSRSVSGFQLLGAEEAGRVCYSGRKVEFNARECQRQDATGAYDGPPSVYRGGGLLLEPAGALGLVNRIAVRLRRYDNDAEEDVSVTDKQASEVLARERFLLPR